MKLHIIIDKEFKQQNVKWPNKLQKKMQELLKIFICCKNLFNKIKALF